jgi:hypothetical protein
VCVHMLAEMWRWTESFWFDMRVSFASLELTVLVIVQNYKVAEAWKLSQVHRLSATCLRCGVLLLPHGG